MKAAYKPIRAGKAMKGLMDDYFRELDAAARSGDRKIAWCTSVGPAEVLRAMGFLVWFPENHAAMLGATRAAADCIPVANSLGYSPEICSYLTSDVGAYKRVFTPLSRAYPGIETIPKPDVLVYNTNQCRDVQDWFQFYQREYDVPILGVHTHRGIGEVTEAHISSVAAQMEQLIEPLEKVAGQRLDESELRRVVGESRQTSVLWKKVLLTAAAKPSPLTFFDACIHMGPAVVLRGDERANRYYEMLLAEMEERVEQGVAAVDGEAYRIYWDGMPVWGKLREHSGLFSSLDTCVVASTYCNSWVFDQLDPADPFNSMARAYTELFIVRSEEAKEKYIREMMETYKVDGIMFHDARTCPNNSNNRYGMPERLRADAGVLSLTINGDLNDLRCYSDEQSRTAIEAFAEQLSQRG